MKDLKRLKEELEKYIGKDLCFRTEGSLRLSMIIHNMDCMVTRKILLIGNADFTMEEEIEINIDDINDIEIDEDMGISFDMNRKL